ncbi:hypothetical protein [Ancylobacter rudongensis]|uniref:Uncharacterized protein n=1 Tax=Ancylobacter rudongensis TaxID=177413 RepID=A0A1G4RKP2_9HYPH|nr:hypothetical protein [Ancylobacter rudongensis]SCW57366.1 hypothetical protein SAMN05660859_1719 [Ancylobacter rudongensis]
MSKAPVWSIERLTAMETAQLKQLLANAQARGADALAAQCEEVLATRGPVKKPAGTSSTSSPGKRAARDYVSVFHFVCENDRGVSTDGEGFFWTGSWVVPEDEVIKSMNAGGKLALHGSRADRSYRQGKILDYRKSDGDSAKKRNIGFEFLVAADDVPLAWPGGGTGEKGYTWASHAQSK